MNETPRVEVGTIDPDNPRVSADQAAHITFENEARGAQDVATVERGQSTAVRLTGEGETIRSAILDLSRDPAFDVEKLRALNDLQNSVEDRQARRLFNAAFVRLQGKLPTIKKDGRLEYEKDKGKPETKYLVTKYAKWEDILGAIQPALASENFSLSYEIEPRSDAGGGLLVSAVLRHGDGHEHTSKPIPVALDTSGGKNNTQAYGSAMSYGQRYSTKALLNLRFEGEDDDGVASGGFKLTKEQAADIKTLVSEAEVDPKEWLASQLNYAVNQYLDILQEDYVRLKRALMSVKDAAERKSKEGMKV